MDAPNPSADHYWCAGPEDEFAAAYWSKVDAQGGLSGYGALASLQRLARRHYFGALPINFIGELPVSSMATRSGDQGQNTEIRVNQFHCCINAKHQIVVAPKLAWGCQATNTNAQSMADADRGASILEYVWKSTPLEMMAEEAEKQSELDGEHFVVTLFNPIGGKMKRMVHPETGQTLEPGAKDEEGKPIPGRIEYEGDFTAYSVPSWDVLRQANAKSWEASPWRSAKIPRNRWDLIAQYPAMKEEILKVPAATTTIGDQSSLVSTSDPDSVVCHYFFHDKTPAVPRGLQAVLLSATCVLQFEELEKCYEHSPVSRCVAKNLPGTPYGYTSSWEGMGIQDLITDVESSLATNIVTFAKQMISAESGTDLPVDQIGNGPSVLYRNPGSEAPEAVQLYAVTAEMLQQPGRYTQSMRAVFGLNDMAFGEPPQGPPNAQAWALLATANITNNSDEQRHYIDFVRSIGRSVLSIIKEKYSEPRKVAIVGKFGPATPEQDTFDQGDFEGIDDVQVTIDNPLMQTAAGRLPIAQMFMDAGFVQVPEQLESVVATGKLEPMTQVLRNEKNWIATENEMILKGEVPAAMLSDSHQLHIREHKDAMFVPNGRTDQATINAYNAHFQQHVNLAMQMTPQLAQLLGQAVPAPAPMPGAPPGGPSSGPPSKKAAPALKPPGAEAQGEAAKIPVPSAPQGTQPNPAGGPV